MKIIKQGCVPEYDFTCKTCGCEFIARYDECECYEMKNVYETRIYKILKIQCPCCGDEIELMV